MRIMVARLSQFALLVFFAFHAGGCGSPSGSEANSASPTGQESKAGADAGSDGASPNPVADVSSEKTQPETPTRPIVVLETSLGEVTIELDVERAPLTVQNFLNYIESGFYTDTVFHQVIEGYAILGGSYSSDWKEKQTQTPVRNEADKALPNTRGTIAMARLEDVIDSATSQFFINLVDNPSLDHKDRTAVEYGYCAFGKVVEGMDVVDRIATVPVEDAEGFPRKPVETVLIKQIRRVR